jgi:outer membrane protein insertion porin family
MLRNLSFKILILLAFITVNSFTLKATVIHSVNYEGLTKTKADFLNQLIKCKSGVEFDTLIIQEDEQTLRNLNLFFSVNSKSIFNDLQNGYDITFIIKEAKYVYPIFAVEGFDSQLKIQAGLSNLNWRGRRNTIGFVYQYYDRHSLSLYQKTPRHKNGKTGHELSLSKYSTIEPLYFDTITSNFNFDNYSVSAVGKFWINSKINFNIGGILMYEKYEQRDDAFELPKKSFNFLKYQIRSSLIYNYVNQHYEFFDGLNFKLYAETIQTKDYPMASFFKLTTQIKYFKRFNKRGNFGVNYKIGVATNNESPFSPFVLDGFLNVRGIGNRVSRGTAENILNIEYRHTLFNKKYFTIQSAIFTDIGSLRQAGEKFETMFTASSMNYFSGIGIRIHSKYFYKSIFRVDYSVNLTDINHGGFSFGLGHFF